MILIWDWSRAAVGLDMGDFIFSTLFHFAFWICIFELKILKLYIIDGEDLKLLRSICRIYAFIHTISVKLQTLLGYALMHIKNGFIS